MAAGALGFDIVPTSVEQELAALVHFVEDYRMTRYIWISVLAVLIYDWALTLNDEVRYIWGKPFRWTHLLFCWNRYWPIANLILSNVILATANNSEQRLCKSWIHLIMFGSMPYEIAICVVYILRVWALYGCSRAMLVLLCGTYASVLIAESTVLSKALKEVAFVPVPIPGITGCLPSNVKPYVWAFWIPMLFFETLLLVLCLGKSLRSIRNQTKSSRLIYVIFRDSVVYFGSVVIAISINIAGVRIGGTGIFATFIPFALGSFSIMASRLLLNIQAAVEPTYTHEYLSTLTRLAANTPNGPGDGTGHDIPLSSLAWRTDPSQSDTIETDASGSRGNADDHT